MTGTPSVDRTVRTLTDLVSFCEIAARIVARGREAYTSDETLRLAAEAILHKIGEAVARLPGELVQTHPEVPWRAMKATRNVVAHDYDQVDHTIIWRALADRLPKEARAIRAILAELTEER